MSRQTPYFPLGGGLDLVTPIIQMPDGKMIAGDNFEPWINGGYRRIKGFERYDGRPKPSDATWVWLTLDDASSYTVGDTITGDTSSASGTIVAIGTGDHANEVCVTKVSGTFAEEGVDTARTSITNVALNDGPTVALEEAWRLAAEDEYRGDIVAVPGTNPIRGVWQCRDRVYAIRDNAGETAAVIHKATSSGWDDAALEMCHTLYFDAGTASFTVGSTLTGGTSAATGTIHKVVVHSGDWGTNDAAGYIALTGVSGTFSDDETITDGGSGSATAASASSAFSLAVGGRYDFVTYNFLASSDTYRAYCAGGTGPAFEIDEDDVVTPILMDLSLGDAPSENNPYLVEVFDGALWLMFPGGSLQKSIAGDPLTFNGFLGAAEFGLSDEGTGLINSAGRVLIAFTRSQTHGIFPEGASGYIKRLISNRSGAIKWTDGEVGSVHAVDDSGLIDLQRVEAFGDFQSAALSDPVQPIMESSREKIIGVQLIRETNQYRVLFSSGAGILFRMRQDGAAEPATFRYDLGDNQTLTCAYSCEDANSIPRYWMAGSSGHVYECERGRNFDGEPIESFCRLPFNHQGAPAVRKRYRLAEVEVKCERSVTLVMAQDRNYGDQADGTSNWSDDVDTAWGGGGFWDLDNWGEVYWDAQLFDAARFELLGTGRNVSLLIYHKTATTDPFILQGVILHFDPRRVQR